MSQFGENLQTDGRTDGRTEGQALFYRTLPAEVGGINKFKAVARLFVLDTVK